MDINETDIAWLAGIIDGEGNLHVGRKTAKSNGRRYLDVKVMVSSTDMRMIKRISEIYKSINIVFHFARVNMGRGSWKPAISINTANQGSCKKILKTVLPYLVNKKDLASSVVEIIEFVQGFPKGGNTVHHNYFEAPRFKELLADFQYAKEWYFDPSTTTRRANSVFEFGDIV